MRRIVEYGLRLSALMICFSGCASVGPAKPVAQPKPVVQPKAAAEHKPTREFTPPLPKERREGIVKEFEARRDKAQLEAACDRWTQGDVAGSESLLLQLLGRNEHNRGARHALADLYAAKPDPAAAQEQLTLLLEQDGSDAQAHYSLGLLFESLGRRQEALPHLEQAARLDATNELYYLSLEACRGE